MPNNINANWITISCNSDGNVLYGSNTGTGVYAFNLYTNASASLIPNSTFIWGAIAYNNGNELYTNGQSYVSNPDFDKYLITYTVNNAPQPPPPPPSVICFKEGSTLLSFIHGKEEYVPIENIRAGTLVKTLLSGYVPVHSIGTSKIYNSSNKLRGKNRLYCLTKDAYPELTDDLIITGCHSLLVDKLSEKQQSDIIDELGRLMVTDRKYRLMAVYDERADTYEEEGLFNIWHLALEHDDERMNYGVYANGGLLVETTSQRMLKEFSGMTLV